jgi:hypothetical protein
VAISLASKLIRPRPSSQSSTQIFENGFIGGNRAAFWLAGFVLTTAD